MKITTNTVDEYINQLPEDRRQVLSKLRQVILENLPDGFVEEINYRMPSYVVPHSIYPAGYHCDPKVPLPFISFASQKNHISFYHMGVYTDPNLLEWFAQVFPKHSNSKLDMGKSCIRFKKPEHIPFGLIAELLGKVTPKMWIKTYESQLKK
ncbi:MAG: DUF1801 domain-containing protein [Bacteroidales bacterium]|nr:DUF1801 domain-containing protein [Bacteroidales bacterium]